MALNVLDANEQTVVLSGRQVTTSRNPDVPGTWDPGLISQTEVYALPSEIENVFTNLNNLIETINSQATFNSTVNRVNNPTTVLTNKRTFSSGGSTLTVTDVTIPDSTNGKTMAYCDLKASSSNQGTIYVGSSDTTLSENNGRELDPGEPITITVNDLSKVSVYSPSPGNSFSYIVYYEE